jgi:hypothetical protein
VQVTVTATQLFAGYSPPADAKERCFYCAGRCDARHKSVDIVKSSFTALDTVTRSDFVCDGCIDAFNERATVTLLDGEVRTEQKTRLYSWIVYGGKRYAATKAHRAQIAKLCLNPPMPPYIISLADSGQRQLLYRARVCTGRLYATVSLEGESIAYRPEQLEQRLKLMKQVCAATGKPALLEPITAQTGMRVVEYFGDAEILTAWSELQADPLTKLAAWLCPPKEECQSEHPEPERTENRPVIAETVRQADSAAGQRAFSWDD